MVDGIWTMMVVEGMGWHMDDDGGWDMDDDVY